MLMEGVCFNLAEAGPRAVGRKAMGVNLSDIAAMAGRPVAAAVSVALPLPAFAPAPTPTPNPLSPKEKKSKSRSKSRSRTKNNELLMPASSGTSTGERSGHRPASILDPRSSFLVPQSTRALAENLYLGLREMADEFQTAIIGGDTNSWDGPLVISVTVLGEATGAGPVRRSGAKPGDWLLVTGPLGGSIRGKHLTFTPRVREALGLHEIVHLHAMIDISDGLAADVNHLCEESNCGAILHAEQIPITAEARLVAQVVAQAMNDGRSPLDHALTDGEDFELVFAVSEDEGRKLIQSQPVPGITLTHIGECVEQGLWLQQQGKRHPLPPRGFQHVFR
jgi:thiamine-monophosphate kinase